MYIKNNRSRRLFYVMIAILIILLLVFIVSQGKHYFSRKTTTKIQQLIDSYGTLSPIIVIMLILLSTIIPPLPLPVPLVEISAGLVFGFWGGFFLVWISQIVSSLFAFSITRFVGNHFFQNVLDNRIFHRYKEFIKEKGTSAVFTTRLLLAAPFNIVSFFAGLTKMSMISFLIATILGTIPESALYTYIGVILKHNHFRLWYVFILVVLIGTIGPFLIYLLYAMKQSKKNSEEN